MKVKDGSLLLQPVHLGHPNALPSLPGDKTDTPSSPTRVGSPHAGATATVPSGPQNHGGSQARFLLTLGHARRLVPTKCRNP